MGTNALVFLFLFRQYEIRTGTKNKAETALPSSAPGRSVSASKAEKSITKVGAKKGYCMIISRNTPVSCSGSDVLQIPLSALLQPVRDGVESFSVHDQDIG